MSGFINGLAGAVEAILGVPQASSIGSASGAENPRELYRVMRELASNTNAYKELTGLLADYGLGKTAMQGLKNPTNAVCGFYAANLWPGTIREDDEQSALPIIAAPNVKNPEKLKSAIHRVWRQSNWNDMKDGAAYDDAMLGGQLFRVVSDVERKRSWFELVQPDYLTDFDVDGRGYLTYVRIDIPMIERDAEGKPERWIYTEIWDKSASRYRQWLRKASADVMGVARLGPAQVDKDLQQMHGDDFVPFVYWRFDRDNSSDLGTPAVLHALDKIVYGDALVTALHQRITRYNEPDWAIESQAVDRNGLAMPPFNAKDVKEIELGGGTVLTLPPGSTIRDLVAGLDYASHLAVVQDHFASLRETDLPELTWYSVSEAGDVSGRSLDYKLTPAKSRLQLARGRGESSLIRTTQMCLTVGQNAGAEGFSAEDIGTYDNGDFDFWFKDRELVPLAPGEVAEIDTARSQQVKAHVEAGASYGGALRLAGYNDDQVTKATDFSDTPEM